MNDHIDTSQWQRLGVLFEQAIGLDAAGRAELLRSIEREDRTLGQALASLLAADAMHEARTAEQRERVLQGSLAAVEVPDVDIGDRVGPYLLREGLGRGGMGVVFLAERADGQVRQKVALKVIKLGMDTREVIARFEAERQALAMMDHPHIARMLDVGSTMSGRPYFVMELVKGEPISSYCSKHDLSIVQRLQLFDQVCAAVQHAHTKSIIHRDLKPNNVLVSMQDGQPFAKVIDFGIAKATSGRLTDKTLLTEQFLMMGTPLYMSPEQAAGSADIDTRTDIYALGVILYELLTDSTPIDSTSLRAVAREEVQRIIREVDPPRPSVRLLHSITTKSGTTKSGEAAMAGLEPRVLARMLRGDLDWIAMKAIEKDRTRRYETANALALDVRRYLAGEAVLAAPPGAGYRMRKFVRRNKGAVAAGSLIAAALLVGIVAFAWQARIAQQHASETEQVAQFEGDMLKQVDPDQAGKQLMDDIRAKLAAALVKAGVGEKDRAAQVATFAGLLQQVNATDAARDLIDRTILKPAISTIDKKFGRQPAVAATLDQVLADRYLQMGLYDAAMPLQQRALSIRRRVLGEENPDTLRSICALGLLLQDQGKLNEAESAFREALAKSRRLLGEKNRITFDAIGDLGGVLYLEGKVSEAEPYMREAKQLGRNLLGEEDPDTLDAVHNLGELLKTEGKMSEAEQDLRWELQKRRRVLGEDDPTTVTTIDALGELLDEEGKLSEAEPYIREALAKDRRILGEDHPNTIWTTYDLGALLEDQGKLSEAEPFVREALEKNRRVLGENHPESLSSVTSLGKLLSMEGKYAEAVQLLSPYEAAQRKAFQTDNRGWFGTFLMRLGRARFALGQFDAAQANLLEAQPIMVADPGVKRVRILECTQDIIDLFTARNAKEPGKGYDAKAVEWKRKLAALKAPAAAAH